MAGQENDDLMSQSCGAQDPTRAAPTSEPSAASWPRGLGAHCQSVLAVLAENRFSGDFEWVAFGFRAISADTGLDRTQVKRACRKLAGAGLAKHERGLWSEDGEPRGSGYRATDAGLHLANATGGRP